MGSPVGTVGLGVYWRNQSIRLLTDTSEYSFGPVKFGMQNARTGDTWCFWGSGRLCPVHAPSCMSQICVNTEFFPRLFQFSNVYQDEEVKKVGGNGEAVPLC